MCASVKGTLLHMYPQFTATTSFLCKACHILVLKRLFYSSLDLGATLNENTVTMETEEAVTVLM